MIGIDAVNNKRLVAGNDVAVANVSPHGLDLRKKVLLESATGCFTNSGRLLIFLHGHVIGVVTSVERRWKLSTAKVMTTAFPFSWIDARRRAHDDRRAAVEN